MTDPTVNDNQRKDVDRWDDEGGRPPSPERSPRPDPVDSLPPLPRSQFMCRRTLPSDPEAAQAILLEYTTEEQSPKTWVPATLIREVCERKIRTKL